MAKMTAQERKWQAESDAHALAESEQIKADPDRLKRAQKAADEIAKDKMADALSIKRVADRGKRQTKKKVTNRRK